jgi:hypothetical protein
MDYFIEYKYPGNTKLGPYSTKEYALKVANELMEQMLETGNGVDVVRLLRGKREVIHRWELTYQKMY